MDKNKLSLVFIYEKTVDWLKFAEAKNAAMLAINCVVFFGVSRLGLVAEISNPYLIYYVCMVLVLLAASICISLLSFIPRLDPPLWVSFPPKPEELNILYFGHICSYSRKSYLEQYYKYSEVGENQSSKEDFQLSSQIITNSKIAYIKYRQFHFAVWLTISALLTPLGAFVVAKIRV